MVFRSALHAWTVASPAAHEESPDLRRTNPSIETNGPASRIALRIAFVSFASPILGLQFVGKVLHRVRGHLLPVRLEQANPLPQPRHYLPTLVTSRLLL